MGSIIYNVIIGGVAGWLGSKIMGKDSNLLRNIIVGILGSFAGSIGLGLIGLSFGSGIIGSIITGTIGAVIVLAIVNYLA